MMQEAMSHEEFSVGLWPGSGAVREPAFYAYAAPQPSGFSTAVVRPSFAVYRSEISNSSSRTSPCGRRPGPTRPSSISSRVRTTRRPISERGIVEPWTGLRTSGRKGNEREDGQPTGRGRSPSSPGVYNT